jgi:hypothetical protein
MRLLYFTFQIIVKKLNFLTKESKIQTYQRMWSFMSTNPDVFVKSTNEGINRVKKGGYAYLLESTTNEYNRQRDCELIQIGGLLDTKGLR